MLRKKISDKRRYYSRYLAHYTKKNHTVLGLGVLFLAGVAVGCMLLFYADSEIVTLLNRMVGEFVENRMDQSLPENFISASWSSLSFVLGLFLCGFSAISQPLEILTPFFRGLGFGFSVSSLYAAQGMAAAGFVALFMLPGMLISTVAILFCARESLRMSGSFFSCIRGDRDAGVGSMRLYVARYMVAAAACLVAAFLEAVLYTAFSGSFFV